MLGKHAVCRLTVVADAKRTVGTIKLESIPPPPPCRPTRQTGRISPPNLAALNDRSLLDNPRSNRPKRRTALVARALARHKVDISARPGSQGRPKADRRDGGVAFAIRNDIVGRLPCLQQDINGRLMNPACLSGEANSPPSLADVPPMTSPDEAKNKFYEDLHALLASVPKADKLTVPGDLNARVGSDHADTGEDASSRK
ncbi:hypothetical protein SprV_0200688700 [Sparganum proliferum]